VVFLSNLTALDADKLCISVTKGQPHMPSAIPRAVTSKQRPCSRGKTAVRGRRQKMRQDSDAE